MADGANQNVKMPRKPAAAISNPSNLLLLIAYLGFISLGLPDTVAGVAWPAVRDTFALPQSGLGFISIAFGCGYFVSSFNAGSIIQRVGTGTLLTVSSGLVAFAMFGNAFAPYWLVFVLCGVIWGLGSGAIDAGLNSFAAQHFSTRHVNWLHACYSLGATIGPLLMTTALVWTESWRVGYGLVGGIVLALTFCFLLTHRIWNEPASTAKVENKSPITMSQVLRHPLVQLQMVIFFLYTGLELMVGQWCFTLLTESRHIPTDHAGFIASGYFGAIGVGRVMLGAVANRFGVDRLLRYSLAAAVLGALLYSISSLEALSIVGLAVLGLGLAPVYPCLMVRTPQRLGSEYAAHAVGFQVSAATLGAATLPAIAGFLAERWGLEIIAHFSFLVVAVLWGLHEILIRWTSAFEIEEVK